MDIILASCWVCIELGRIAKELEKYGRNPLYDCDLLVKQLTRMVELEPDMEPALAQALSLLAQPWLITRNNLDRLHNITRTHLDSLFTKYHEINAMEIQKYA